MKIKNIGDKIIHVGSTVLLPEKEMKASKAVCETPAIKAFVKAGFLAIEEEAKTGGRSAAAIAEAKAKAKAEAEAKAKAEAEAKAAAEAAANAETPDNQ